MAIVGSAQVRISPDTKGFRPGVRAALESIRPIARSAGGKAGDDFGKAFDRSMSRSFSGLQRTMERQGRQACQSFIKGFG